MHNAQIKFQFLTGAKEIVHSCEDDIQYDLFIAQDCGDELRLGDAAKYFKTAKKTICVDHHVSNVSFDHTGNDPLVRITSAI